LQPAANDAPWSLHNPTQWGEAYLSLASERDLRYAEPISG
jgi:hypothetical protein